MKTIYNECLGNAIISYSAFCETDLETKQNVYGIIVRDNYSEHETVIRNFTAKKEKAIEFIETLIRNAVYPDFVNDIAEDFLLA